MKKLKALLDKVLAVLLSLSILSMVFVAILGVFTRFVLKNPASFTTEYLRYSLLWTSLFAAAYVFGEKGHIAIEYVKNKFNGKLLLAVNILIELCIIFFAVTVLIYGGYQGIIMGRNEISPTLYIQMNYIYIALPVSGIFITFYSIINLMDLLNSEKAN